MLLDAGDPLCLWKFARAHHQIRDTVRVISTDLLDEYEMYRSSQHSYYFADDKPPNLMWIVPGGGFKLRSPVIETMDPHGVPSFHQGYLVEVWSVMGEGIPISTPPSQLGKVPAFVVEGALPIPIWVLGPESTESLLRPLAVQLVETLAYWIWQFELLLAPVLALVAGDRSTYVIEFVFDEPSHWVDAREGTQDGDNDRQSVIPSAETTATGLKLTIHSSLSAQLATEDNRGDRQLLVELLRHIREALAHKRA